MGLKREIEKSSDERSGESRFFPSYDSLRFLIDDSGVAEDPRGFYWPRVCSGLTIPLSIRRFSLVFLLVFNRSGFSASELDPSSRLKSYNIRGCGSRL